MSERDQKWVLCPIFGQPDMDPSRSVPQAQFFQSKKRAKQAQRKAQGRWFNPVPIRSLNDYQGGPYRGELLRNKGRETNEISHEDYLSTLVADAVQQRILPLSCYLADDWCFPEAGYPLDSGDPKM